MRNRLREALIAIVTAVVVGGLAPSMTRTAGQTQGVPGTAATAQGGREARLQWSLAGQQRRELGPADPCRAPDGGSARRATGRAGPGRAGRRVGRDRLGAPDVGVVEGDEIPYQPWAAKRKQENFDNWLDRDPEIACYLPGTPRAMYMPYKFQIIQGTNKIMMVFEFAGAVRTLHLDEVDPYPADAYMGHSVAKWEGDTLVVDVSSFTRADVVRPGRELSQRRPPSWSNGTLRSAATRSATRPRSTIPRCSPAPGRSACRSTVVSNRTRG